MRLILALACTLIFLSGCASQMAAPTPTSLRPTAMPEPPAILTAKACSPAPVTAPTRPAFTPGYTQLDPVTNLHMTGEPVELDLASYRLNVTGRVERPLALTYDALRCMPRMTDDPTLICPGVFEDVATWSGVPLAYILDLAGAQSDATSVYLISADGYEAFLLLEEARDQYNFLAYEWEGEPLPVLHGFPVRAVIPAQKGAKWVKWLVEIRVE